MKKIIFIIGIVYSTACFAQEKVEYIDIESLRTEITTYSKEKEYDKIINVINKVNKNDSIYNSLLVTKSYYLMQLEKFKEAIDVTQEGLQNIDSDSRLSFYINQSIAYRNLEDYQSALKTLDRGLKEFPKSNKLYYHKGLVYDRNQDYQEAVEMYKLSAIINPFYPDVHLKIGSTCLKQHLTAQALMCFNTYLLLNPDGVGSFQVLNAINKLLTKNYDDEKLTGFKISEDDEFFEEIDLILNNKIALNADYKIDNEINIAFVKQNHALFQQLKSFSGNGGFWESKYVRLFKWINNNGYFDDFVYTTTYSIENPKYKKIVDKKTNQVKAFLKIFKKEWAEIMQKNEIMFNGKKQEVSYYYTNYELNGIGTMKNGVPVNSWEFFNSSGKFFSKGDFNADGKRIGKWVWFHKNGKIKEILYYDKGKLEGKNISYYKNGKTHIETTYSNDLLNGNYKFYNKHGALVESKSFNNSELDGKYNSYYEIGESTREYDVQYKGGVPIGDVIQYFPDGKKQFEVSYKEGEKHGKERRFYANGIMKSESDYVKGKFHGNYRYYNKNKVLIEEGSGIENEHTGLWKEYYHDGKLKNEYTYKNGQIDGAYFEYAPNGKLYYEYTYRKDELIAYKFLNQKGKVIKEGRKKGGEFFYEGYAINGNKTTEGLYNINGGKEGEWKFYSDNGTLLSKGIYNNNKVAGEYLSYFKNGKVESRANYTNDILSGYYVEYHKNGEMASQGWYKESNAHKEWRYYYKNGTLESINFYHKGNFHGEQKYFSVEGKIYKTQMFNYGDIINEKIYNHKGELIEEINFKDYSGNYKIETHHANKNIFSVTTFKFGLKHGVYKLYDYYGNKILEGNYMNGKASGKWVWYYQNGNIEREITFISGEYHGIVYDYYENGNLKDKSEYNLGDRINTSYSYAEDGKTLIVTTEYLNGKQQGRKVFYSTEGKLQLIRFYEYGRLVGYSYLNKEGKELPVIDIKNETAKIVSYFDNGNKAREMEFVNGDIENKYKSYYYNGKLHQQHFDKNGDYDGKLTVYYPDGKLKEEIMYKNDERNGYSKKYYANGQLKEVVHYLNDSKSGEAKYYNEKGKLIKKENYFNDYIYETKQF
ncbi:MAG: hypothetical protein ABFS35_07635 [Bacteroidota bacterium]